ncbi:MAG: tetratricopeptide repeat protein [Thermodesulfobacteriota bacterium]
MMKSAEIKAILIFFFLSMLLGCVTTPPPEKQPEDRLERKDLRAINKLAREIARERSEDFFLTGMREYNKGDFQDAYEAFSRAVVEDPKDYRSYFFLGQTHEQLRDPEKAVNDYKKALEVRPHYLPAQEALGLVNYKQKKFKEAEINLREAEKLGSKTAEVYYTLGEIEQRNDACEKAITAYEQALRLNPDYVAAQNGLKVAQFTCRQKQHQQEQEKQIQQPQPAQQPPQKSLKPTPRR